MSSDVTLRLDPGAEELVFASGGTVWWVAAHGGPDLTTMDDRQRAVLRALLTLSLKRLDRTEREMIVKRSQGGESGVQ